MAPTARPDRRLTYDDFLLFPEGDGLRHEIIDGVHYVTRGAQPPPSGSGGTAPPRDRLTSSPAHPGIGRVFLSPLDVVFTLHDIVEPDLLFVAGDQIEIMTEKNIQGAPAIVVEVVSKSTRSRDERIKKRTLRSRRRAGVLDRRSRAQSTHRSSSRRRRLDARTPLSAADRAVLTTPLLPGFSLAVSELFKPSI